MSKNDFLTDYLNSLYGISVLDSKDEYILAERIAKGDASWMPIEDAIRSLEAKFA